MTRFGQVKRRDETENIRAVVEMKIEGKRSREDPGRDRRTLYEWIGKPGTPGRNRLLIGNVRSCEKCRHLERDTHVQPVPDDRIPGENSLRWFGHVQSRDREYTI